MSTIVCSTGALLGRPNGRDFRLLTSLVPQLDCDGFEFMMYSTWYDTVGELLAVLRSLGCAFPVMHCEKRIGEAISMGQRDELCEAYRLFEINCEIAGELGAQKLVFHLWDGLTSDCHFDNNLAAYPRLTETAAGYGLELLVENVVCNERDPLSRWIELCQRYPDVRFAFDTKMAAFHGQLERLYDTDMGWLWTNGHIRHYHVNDYGGGYKDWAKLRTLPIGKGHIDFERFFAFVKQTGYADTFTVEATAFDQTGAVDTAMLNEQFAYIRKAVAHLRIDNAFKKDYTIDSILILNEG